MCESDKEGESRHGILMDFKSQIGANPPRIFLRDILHFSDGEIAMTKKDTVNTREAHFHSFSTKRGSVSMHHSGGVDSNKTHV